jgi:hypothetical protein
VTLMSDSSRCAGVIPQVTATPRAGGPDQIECRGGRHLTEMDRATGLFGEHQVARDRQRLGDGGRRR